MSYTVVALKNKIMEMYPEIAKNGVEMELVFNEEKSTYFVNFRKDRKVFATHLQESEADACMNGIKFVFLGSQIGRWMKNFVAVQAQTTDMLAAQTAQDQRPVQELYRRSGSWKEEQWATQ